MPAPMRCSTPSRSRAAALAQHRLGCLGQRRRGPERQHAPAINPPEGRRHSCGCSGRRRVSRARGGRTISTDRLKAWVRHVAASADEGGGGRAGIPAPESADRLRGAAHRDRASAGGDLGDRSSDSTSVGIHDRFFDLGGHSLLAAQVASEICDRFQIEMPVLKLFQAPTSHELGALVDQARSGEAVPQPTHRAARLPVVEASPLVPTTAVAQSPGDRREGELPRVLRRRDAASRRSRESARRRSSSTTATSPRRRRRGAVRGTGARLQPQLGPARLRAGRQDGPAGHAGARCRLRPRRHRGAAGRAVRAEAIGVDLSPEAIAFCRKRTSPSAVALRGGRRRASAVRRTAPSTWSPTSSHRTPIRTCAHSSPRYAAC